MKDIKIDTKITNKYNFYMSDEASISPLPGTNPKIGNLYDMYDILSLLWSKETCAPRMRDNWSTDNKTLGQCSITAFLIQDIFGGDVYGIRLADGNFHCYNVIEGKIFDLTSEQFKEKLIYDLKYPQERVVHFNKQEKYERYLLLKTKLEVFLNN